MPVSLTTNEVIEWISSRYRVDSIEVHWDNTVAINLIMHTYIEQHIRQPGGVGVLTRVSRKAQLTILYHSIEIAFAEQPRKRLHSGLYADKYGRYTVDIR